MSNGTKGGYSTVMCKPNALPNVSQRDNGVVVACLLSDELAFIVSIAENTPWRRDGM
jgi:hypothetical protein